MKLPACVRALDPRLPLAAGQALDHDDTSQAILLHRQVLIHRYMHSNLIDAHKTLMEEHGEDSDIREGVNCIERQDHVRLERCIRRARALSSLWTRRTKTKPDAVGILEGCRPFDSMPSLILKPHRHTQDIASAAWYIVRSGICHGEEDWSLSNIISIASCLVGINHDHVLCELREPELGIEHGVAGLRYAGAVDKEPTASQPRAIAAEGHLRAPGLSFIHQLSLKFYLGPILSPLLFSPALQTTGRPCC